MKANQPKRKFNKFLVTMPSFLDVEVKKKAEQVVLEAAREKGIFATLSSLGVVCKTYRPYIDCYYMQTEVSKEHPEFYVGIQYLVDGED
ncbi:hypothetical protein [Vibrio sp. ED002]|uniref:hypothetical protein n=1 Tax=Vibrio sp. ED002 TaxID=2785123 RepID=UPI0020109389|nr:hypothetical protein [Vibrio sp. ED002]UQA51682.1 hypothetical protein ITG12_04955 [Vibrio sp. ED002]